MQVTVHLTVDEDSFFDQLKDAIFEDIKEARGKKAKTSNVHQGYSFKRYLGGKQDEAHAAQVHIVVWDPPHRYVSTITSNGAVTTLTYEVVPADGGGIDVTYSEEFDAATATQNVLSRVVASVKLIRAKSRVRNQLHLMEGRILAEQYPDAEGPA